jgi:hypothetical protein
MSNNIPVVTQEEFEPKVLPKPKVAMALPNMDPILVAQFPKKKLLQMTLWGKVKAPAPVPDFIQVQSHNRGSIQVQAHKRKITSKPNGNKKKAKSIKSEKKTGQAKAATLAKVPDDCKESVQLAHSLHFQEIKNLFNSFKK